MDIKKDFSCVEKTEKIFAKTYDVEGDYQQTLPAYLDDVYRVVKCTADSFITSSNISFNEVKIFAKCVIKITYYNENATLCYADFEEEFSKVIAVDNMSENAFVRAKLSDKYASFRVINQRRIDIHTVTCLSVTVYDTVQYPYLSACDHAKLKREAFACCRVVQAFTDKIEFDEDAVLPANSPAIGRIISSASFVSLDQVRVIKDKLLVKVNLNTSVLYTADAENNSLQRADYVFALSKIIERPGIDEGDAALVDCSVRGIFFKVKAAANEKQSLINIYGDIALGLTFVREQEQSVITDGYIIGNESSCTYTQLTLNTHGKFLTQSKNATVPLVFNGEFTEIKELDVKIKNVSFKDGELRFTADASAVLQDGDSVISQIASSDTEIALESFDDALVSVNIDSYDYTLAGGGKVDLRLNLNLSVYGFTNSIVQLLSDIDAGNATPHRHTFTVYFGKENEQVWDIAKRFSADTNAIIQENGLSSDALDAPGVLIIPGA